MEICSGCNNKKSIHCEACKENYCMSCAISQHFSPQLKSHSMNYLCENCREEVVAKLFCDECGQVLCLECDKTIHNKGKRARHAREAISSFCLDKVASIILVTGSFLQQEMASQDNLNNLRSQFSKILSDLDTKSESEKLSLVILADDFQNIGFELFSELVKEEGFQNTLLYKAFSDACSRPQDSLLSRENSFIMNTVELFGKIQALYLFGTTKNEQIVHLFGERIEQVYVGAKSVDSLLQSENAAIAFSPERLSQDSQDEEFSGSDNYIESFQNQKDSPKIIVDSFGDLTPKENMDPNYFQPPNKKQEMLSQQKVREIENFVLRELIQSAKIGEPLILKETLMARIQKSFNIGDMEVELVLNDFQNRGLIHSVIRKFLHYNPYHYFGLLLKGLDVASLIYVLKSIQNDRMTPTEKLILSRIKECYGLKIDQNKWRSILTSISSSQSEMPDSNPLRLKQILDPVTQMDTHAIYLANEDWLQEDQGEVDYSSNEWILFEEFLNEFFKDEEKEAQVIQETQKGSRWNSSVENILNKACFDNENEKSLSNTNDTKAIPGGRYGCVQFIKYCGPKGLRSQSLGKLSLLVQAAINKGIVKYHKTLLIKNACYQEDTADSKTNLDFESEIWHSLNEQRKTKLISTVREALLEILMENATGIALAQIPFQLKRKLKMTVDFQQLGYAKLKDFLGSMKNLIIFEASNTNHIIVKLKNPFTMKSNQQVYGSHKNMRKRFENENSGYNMSRKNPAAKRPGNYHSNQFINKNQLVSKVLFYLEQFLKQRPQGTSIQDLYQKLGNEMEIEKVLKMIECPNFYDFLIHYAERLVVIGAAKNGYTIYPKNYGFWQSNSGKTF